MNRKLRIWLFLIVISCFMHSATPPFGSIRSAYKHHFRGNLYYQKEELKKAEHHFRRAYQTLPSNFGFALSYGVCLARNGDAADGLEALRNGASGISREDPEYDQKQILSNFFEGFILCLNGNYDLAIHHLEKSIQLQEQYDNPAYLSIFYNTLGYASLLNQGAGDNGRDGLPLHYHVHRRDMERARDYFAKALKANPSNSFAQSNFQILSDSLQLSTDTYLKADSVENELRYTSESDVSNDVFELLDFAANDEVLFLLDISGSMVMEKVVCKGRDRFSVMKETALYVLNQILDSTKVGIATIGGDCGTPPKLWEEVGAINKKDLKQSIEFLAPDGTTPLLTILQETPSLFSGKARQNRSIFFISDGANICNAGNVDICEWASRLNQQGITINIFTFLDATFNHVNAFAEYSCLADNTHGKIVYMDNLRCKIERYSFEFVEQAQLEIPELHRVSCLGPSVKELWAIFEE